MDTSRFLRHVILAVFLLLAVLWAFSSSAQKENGYPNDAFITDAHWLKNHLDDKNVVIADLRADKYFDGGLIPGAIRMVWSDFRFNDIGDDLASTFIGVKQAQVILGRHGITRNDTVVLYDSIERDGGATASYVFWVLDVIGHAKKMILEQGVDGWKNAGFDLVTEPRTPKPLLYQAPAEMIRRELLIDGDFVYKRLGDSYYQIVDGRSREEYLGQKGTKGIDGEPLKLGHIPTAVNISYKAAWTDLESKRIKSYTKLQKLYKGLDPAKGVIIYCNSGRRSSFSYFVMRLMGFENIFTYEASWKEWGNPEKYYPVETRENIFAGENLPEPLRTQVSASRVVIKDRRNPATTSGEPSGGYVSCGG
jgi:thiosulfate/3-mercaptopyruvate sulfurtransferase